MSQQIQITGGAKVRDLQDVIIGSSGVLSSLGFDVANGVPKLDSNGKILVSQLPNSVMEYKGTWDASTNTPTLANGTGNQGDVYLCNVAGTVNFGAGPIAFIVGDSAVYSGSIWQRSGGATGSVSSVGLSTNGGAITIGSSPITTSGTISFNFNGTNLQYVNGAGNLTTFPTLITSIGLSMPSAFSVANSPLTANGTIAVTGAGTTAQYIRGDGSLATFPTIATEAQRLITEVYNETGATLTKGTVVYINGGHGNLPTITKAIATGDATSAQTYGIVQTDITNNNNGYVVVIGSLGDLDTQAYANGTQLYLSSTTAGAWTSTKQYAPAHLVYVGIVVRSHPTQGVVEVRIQNGFEMDELHNVSAQSPSNGNILQYVSSTSLWTSVAGTTTNIAEGTNLYYTDARARASLSFVAGSGAYNSTTGVITIPTNNNQITNGANYITLASLSSSATGLTYTNTTGVFSLTAGYSIPTTASQANWDTAYTNRITSATTPLSITSNVISISQSSSTISGYLSSTDWNTFNNKQAAIGYTPANDSLVVHLAGTETITGAKSFSGTATFSSTLTTTTNLTYSNSGFTLVLQPPTLSANKTITLPNTTGTLALLSDITSAVTSVTATSPLSSSGGLTPNITIAQATTSTSGYLSSTDWNTFNGKMNGQSLTAGKMPFSTGTSSLGDTVLNYNGGFFGFNTAANASYRIDVSGSINVTGTYYINGVAITTGGISGSGTTNYLSKFTGTSTIGNSVIYDNGSSVLIGTTDDGGKLVSYSTAGGTQIKAAGIAPAITFSNTVLSPTIGAVVGAATSTNQFMTGTSAGDMIIACYFTGSIVFGTGSTTIERARFSSGGNLLLGIGTDAGYKLDVNGTGRFSGDVTIKNTSTSANLFIDAAATGGSEAGLYFKNGGTNKWENYTANNDTALNWYSYANSTVVFKLASTGAATFSSSVTATNGTFYNAAGGTIMNIYSDNTTTDNILLVRGNSGSTIGLAVKGSGNVGIGTSSPTSYITRFLEVSNATSSGIKFSGATSGLNAGVSIGFITSDNSFRITNYETTGVIRFETQDTERMRITSSGTISATSNATSGYSFTLGSQNATQYIQRLYSSTDSNSSTAEFLMCDAGASVQRMSVRGNGGIYNYATNNVVLSDERLKKDITPLESVWDKVKGIEIVKYKFKDQSHNDFNMGVIAQQVELVAPELIDLEGFGTLDEDGTPYKGIYESDIHYYSIKALQECMSKIEEQQAQIEELKQIVATINK